MEASVPKLIAKRYQAFAREEAKGVSDLYDDLATKIAESDQVLGFLARLPEDRQQPNLFFAALREVCGTPPTFRELLTVLERHGERIEGVMRSRTTQTNEPGRCAVLLPALANQRQPLALLEIGASAGLCLLPDKYAYDYGHRRLPASGVSPPAPVFPCRANQATPLPAEPPDIRWRAGIDLNPLDVARREDMRWLEALIWPGQEGRVERFRAAVDIARADPPRVVRGDFFSRLRGLADTAPKDLQLVIFHTAVLNYVTPADKRDRFVELVGEIDAVWISNESPKVFPEIAAAAPAPPAPDWFLLAVDGNPVAWTKPHGQAIAWFG